MPQRENLTPLTDGQRSTAGANAGLAWWAAGLFPRLVEALGEQEAVSLACLALCRAVRAHDPARGKLSTAVVVYVRQELVHAVERSRRQKRGAGRKALPLDERKLPGVRDPEPHEVPAWLLPALGRLGTRDRRIVRLWAGLDGGPLTDREIGRRVRLPKWAVRERRRLAIAKLRRLAPMGAA